MKRCISVLLEIESYDDYLIGASIGTYIYYVDTYLWNLDAPWDMQMDKKVLVVHAFILYVCMYVSNVATLI